MTRTWTTTLLLALTIGCDKGEQSPEDTAAAQFPDAESGGSAGDTPHTDTAAEDGEDSGEAVSLPTLYERVADDPDLSTFHALIDAHGGEAVWATDATYTVFAPTNASIDAFVEAQGLALDDLLEQAATDGAMLPYFWLAGAQITASDFDALTILQTAANHSMMVTQIDGNVHINGEQAQVLAADQMAANGALHVVDGFIEAFSLHEVPQMLPAHFSVVEGVVERGDPSPITGDEDSPLHTVFAPTNTAFAALFEEFGGTEDEFFSLDIDFGALLEHFVATGSWKTGALDAGTDLTMLNGQVLPVEVATDAVRIDGARIEIADIVCRNGVWHGLNTVLRPPGMLDAASGAGGGGAYPACETDADCGADMFCGIECWTGGCGEGGDVAAGTMMPFCQPCDECHYGTDAVSGSCDSCGGATHGDPLSECLVFRAEARLPDGSASGVFSAADNIEAAGIVENMCAADSGYTTSSTCLLSVAEVDGPESRVEGLMCGMAFTTHTIPAMGELDSTIPMGTLSAGEYTLTVTFGGSETASTAFTVAP